jgi:DNA-binding transcriptional ArsR family regulator
MSRIAMEEVLSLLPSDPTPVRWQDLLAKARSIGMSSATLSKHLKQFVRLGMVTREVDSTSYPPKVLYRRIPHPISRPEANFPVEKMDSVWLTIHMIPALSRMLSGLENRAEAETSFDRILKYNLSRLAAYLAWAIREVLSEPTLNKADERVGILMETYIASWIRGLTELCYKNKDISSQALSRNAQAILELTNDRLSDLTTPEVRKIMQEG